MAPWRERFRGKCVRARRSWPCLVHCTGVERLHWSLHWCRCIRPLTPATFGPGLDLALLLQAMGAGLHRAAGDAQALGDRGDFEPLVPECDEFRLGLQRAVFLSM
jgi:hypothetical protein